MKLMWFSVLSLYLKYKKKKKNPPKLFINHAFLFVENILHSKNMNACYIILPVHILG